MFVMRSSAIYSTLRQKGSATMLDAQRCGKMVARNLLGREARGCHPERGDSNFQAGLCGRDGDGGEGQGAAQRRLPTCLPDLGDGIPQVGCGRWRQRGYPIRCQDIKQDEPTVRRHLSTSRKTANELASEASAVMDILAGHVLPDNRTRAQPTPFRPQVDALAKTAAMKSSDVN